MLKPLRKLSIPVCLIAVLNGCSHNSGHSPNEIVLHDNTINNVYISSKPEVWTDDFILYKVPNGTRARKLETKKYSFVGGSSIDRVQVELASDPSKKGWVMGSDVHDGD